MRIARAFGFSAPSVSQAVPIEPTAPRKPRPNHGLHSDLPPLPPKPRSDRERISAALVLIDRSRDQIADHSVGALLDDIRSELAGPNDEHWQRLRQEQGW